MKDFKIYISVASIFLLIYLVALYNRPAPVNWSATLYPNDKIPFGTYLFYQQLNHLFPGSRIIKTNTSIYRTFHNTDVKAGSYIIIAKSVEINKTDFKELVKYISVGNSVFITCFTLKGFLSDTLKISTGFETDNPSINFTNSLLKHPIDYIFKKEVSTQYFSAFDTAKAVAISKNNYGHSTYLGFKFGKGNLYLSVNPLIFTNINLLNESGADYAAKAMSYLPVTKNIYWDQYQNNDLIQNESPLRVFFNNPDLQWAYYTALFGLLIFVLYEIKRRQRIIPVIEPLNNSTLDFVNVVGQVYYEKRNNANIVHKKILYLLTYLRDEYNIKTNKLDKDFIEKLTTKLGIDKSLATEFVYKIHQYDTQAVINDTELIELNQLIEKFYTQAN